MAEGNSLDWQGVDIWDGLVGDSGDGFNVDRELLDDSDMQIVKNKLRTYDVADNMDMHDALDASHHQHLDDLMDEKNAKRKRDESEEERTARRRLKGIMPWSLKINYIFLFLCNFLMLFIYYISDFMEGVPRAVWLIIVLIHLSAIGLYMFDTVLHTLQENGLCIPKQVRNV